MSTMTDELRDALNASARYLSQNRPEDAIAVLEPLRKKAAHIPDVAINLGGAYILLRKWNRAVRVLEPAAQQHVQNAMLWTNLAAAYLGSLETAGPKQQRQAIAAYERVLEIDSKAPNVHYHLGLIYKEQGDWANAERYFQGALDVNPADRDARLWLSRLSAVQDTMGAQTNARSNGPLAGGEGEN
ncbi:MAG: tetratricopeptide repeat protein [Caldilineaceae bacterium]